MWEQPRHPKKSFKLSLRKAGYLFLKKSQESFSKRVHAVSSGQKKYIDFKALVFHTVFTCMFAYVAINQGTYCLIFLATYTKQGVMWLRVFAQNCITELT